MHARGRCCIERSWALVSRHRELITVLLLFAVAVIPRIVGLGLFSMADEATWVHRSCRFLDALGKADWRGTQVETVLHPGVTTWWSTSLGILAHYFPDVSLTGNGLEVSGSPLAEICRPSMALLTSARYPLVLIASLAVVASYILLRKSLGKPTALLAALLIALDPFYVALSRTIDDDSLCGTFSVLAILCLGKALTENARWSFAVSGMFAGLAFLSKTPAVGLVPLVWVASPIVYGLRMRHNRAWSWLFGGLGMWSAAMIATVLLVWPSMLVQPLQTLAGMFSGRLLSDSWGGTFFLGAYRPDPGPFFYPLVMLFRMSPFVMVGSVVTLISLGDCLRGLPKRALGNKESWYLLLWGLTATYVVGLSLFGALRSERYVLASLLAVDVLGAIGLVTLVELVGERVSGRKQVVLATALSLIALLQAALCLGHFPYYSTYYNPLLGGGAAATQAIRVGQGEGLERVANYLNSRENAEDLYVGFNCLAMGYLRQSKGHILHYPYRYNREERPPRHWAQTDYVVMYGGNPGRTGSGYSFTKFLNSVQPGLTVQIKGIEYASVYRIPKERFAALPSEATGVDVTYQNGLQLAGYQTYPLFTDRGRHLVPVTLYWRSEYYCRSDYQAVLKLRNDAYTIWGSQDVFPACKDSEDSWQEGLILPDEYILEVLPGTPPGEYTLELIVLSVPDGEYVRTIGSWSGILGSVEIPSHPAGTVQSLDTEHEINANLAGEIVLLGYNIAGGAQQGEELHLTLFWQALQDLKEDYKVFVHVVDEEGTLVAQKDSEPANGFYPTDQWQSGEIVRDQYAITVSDVAEATASGLRVGMYKPTGERLSVLLANGVMPEDKAVPIP